MAFITCTSMTIVWLVKVQAWVSQHSQPLQGHPNSNLCVNPGAPEGSEADNDVQVWNAPGVILAHPHALLVCYLPKKLIHL